MNVNKSIQTGFDKSPDGIVLGTLKNERIVESLRKKYHFSRNMPESIKNEVAQFYISHTAFSGNMIDLYETPEEAQRANERKILTNTLNKKYLEDKNI